MHCNLFGKSYRLANAGVQTADGCALCFAHRTPPSEDPGNEVDFGAGAKRRQRKSRQLAPPAAMRRRLFAIGTDRHADIGNCIVIHSISPLLRTFLLSTSISGATKTWRALFTDSICQRAAEAWVRPPVSKIDQGFPLTHFRETRRMVLLRIFKSKRNK